MELSDADLVQQLLDSADALRGRVNELPRRDSLYANREVWNTLCSSMDVVSDTCQALHSYFAMLHEPHGRDIGATYLLAYGVLQALYLQQDAVFWWLKSLGFPPVSRHTKESDWARTVPKLWAARLARNNTVGHPAHQHRRKDVAPRSFFIVQHSASVHGFEFVEMTERGVAWFPFRRVSFPELIEGQMRSLAVLLGDAANYLDSSPESRAE